jgi:hypothetical protein
MSTEVQCAHGGQAVQFRIDSFEHNLRGGIRRIQGHALLRHGDLFLPPFAICANTQCLQRHLACHPMQPPVQAPLLTEASGLPGQHQERRLRGILGIIGIAQHAQTGPIDHRTVPRDQFRKCGVVAVRCVAFEEFPVGFELHDMTSLPEHSLPSTPMLTKGVKRLGPILQRVSARARSARWQTGGARRGDTVRERCHGVERNIGHAPVQSGVEQGCAQQERRAARGIERLQALALGVDPGLDLQQAAHRIVSAIYLDHRDLRWSTMVIF